MIVLTGSNPSLLYYDALDLAYVSKAAFSISRCGLVKDLGPAVIELTGQHSRLLYLRERGFNPFFALIEAAWMLSGSNALSPLTYVLKNYSRFSDDGLTLNGAYGFRLRHSLGFDQIKRSIDVLRNNPSSRRVVLQIWSGLDLGHESNDIPCNISVMLKLRRNNLDITVINRSNDLFTGVPYNLFVFHALQIYIARELGVEPGFQRHFTDSLHIYESDLQDIERVLARNSREGLKRVGLSIRDSCAVDHICSEFSYLVEHGAVALRSDYLRDVFDAFNVLRDHSYCAQFLSLLPRDALGFSAFLWADRYRHIDKLLIPELFLTMMELLSASTTEDLLSRAKYDDIESLSTLIQDLATRHQDKLDTLLATLKEGNRVFVPATGTAIDRGKFLQIVLLSVLLGSLDPWIANSEPGIEVKMKVRDVCNLQKISYNDVLFCLPFYEEIVRILG